MGYFHSSLYSFRVQSIGGTGKRPEGEDLEISVFISPSLSLLDLRLATAVFLHP